MKSILLMFFFLMGCMVVYSQDKFMTDSSKVYKSIQVSDTLVMDVALKINFDKSNNTLQPNAYGIIGSDPDFGQLKRYILQTQSKAVYTQDTSRLTYLVFKNANNQINPTSLSDQSSQLMLKDSLMSLVLDKYYLPGDFVDNSSVRTVNGKVISVKVLNNMVYLNGKKITIMDEFPYNGVIYQFEE